MIELAGYRWKILVMVYVCMLSFALVFQSVPPLLTLIRQELNISHAQAGLLMSLFALPGIFVAIPGGVVSDRFGMRKTGVTSLGLMIAGTLALGTSSSPVQAYAGRVVSGVGGLTLTIVLPQLLSKWFVGKELGLGMGVYNTAMPLGTILSLNVFTVMSQGFGWQVPIFVTTLVSVVALLTFLLLYREPVEEARKARSRVMVDLVGLGSSIWFVGLSWMWFNATLISFITFSPDFLVSRGYEIGSVGLMSSLVMFGSLFLSPGVGYVVHRFGRENMFIGAGGVLLAALIFLVPTSSFVVSFLILIGIAASFVPAPTYSLPPKIVKPENLGLAFGIMTACLNIGVLGGPYLVGSARDLTGDYILGFHLMTFFAVLLTITIGLFSLLRVRKEKRQKTPDH
ncbi:MAG: MFS transporter [Candidatus Bathyarchaeia archaeon]